MVSNPLLILVYITFHKTPSTHFDVHQITWHTAPFYETKTKDFLIYFPSVHWHFDTPKEIFGPGLRRFLQQYVSSQVFWLSDPCLSCNLLAAQQLLNRSNKSLQINKLWLSNPLNVSNNQNGEWFVVLYCVDSATK